MSVRIGSNISSLQAQRRLGEATASLSTTYERLASGQRINRASDDAAGLAISKTLDAEAKILTQGVRNLNDGMSYTAIAGCAVKELKSILLRQRELSTQAANGTYSDKQRQALETEINELSSEWNRILDSTSFNGRRVFSAREGSLTLQAGIGTDAVLQAFFGSEEAAAQDDLIRFSVTPDGAEGNESSVMSSLSPNGRFVAFSSVASNLVVGDTDDGLEDVFVRDFLTGETRKISCSATGGASNDSSSEPIVSPDGRFIVFSSYASNLVAGDTADSCSDIFLKDLRTGETTKLTNSALGGAANENSFTPRLSADGRFVTFYSNASNLVAGDIEDGVGDIFQRDLETGVTSKAITSSSGGAINNSIYGPSISDDGRFVTFYSLATNLVAGDFDDGLEDIFVKDLHTGEMRKITHSTSGGAANGGSNFPNISGDGRFVVFQSDASNLVDDDVDAGWTINIFINDLETGVTRNVTTSSSGGAADSHSGSAVLSADGRYVAFGSIASNLVAGDTADGVEDIFVRDLRTGEIRKLTQSGDGGPANGDSCPPCISADGRYIGFVSNASNLCSGDSGSYPDALIVGNPLSEWSTVSRNQWLSVATESEALLSQSRIDSYLIELNGIEGALGAIEARIGTAVSTLRSMTENFRAAESRIVDADVGQEAGSLMRTQIVQQAAASVLAQANLHPQMALTLLS